MTIEHHHLSTIIPNYVNCFKVSIEEKCSFQYLFRQRSPSVKYNSRHSRFKSIAGEF